MIANTTYKSDVLGAVASGLCAVHCLATPLLFAVQSCSAKSCCDSSPFWWSSIDYFFIVITFFAVYQSSKNTSKPSMKYILFSTWTILSLIVINEKIGFLDLSEWWKYLAAGVMIALHLYNLKFCKCSGDSCCVPSAV